MQHMGLAKLVEELGELQQVAGKMLQYPELMLSSTARHPDGRSLRACLTVEASDVLAALAFVILKLKLDEGAIQHLTETKLAKYMEWDDEL